MRWNIWQPDPYARRSDRNDKSQEALLSPASLGGHWERLGVVTVLDTRFAPDSLYGNEDFGQISRLKRTGAVQKLIC